MRKYPEEWATTVLRKRQTSTLRWMPTGLVRSLAEEAVTEDFSTSVDNCLALSSGESELCGFCNGPDREIWTQQLLKELSIQSTITVAADGSAAKGIASRRGSGKVKHLETRSFFLIQDKAAVNPHDRHS